MYQVKGVVAVLGALIAFGVPAIAPAQIFGGLFGQDEDAQDDLGILDPRSYTATLTVTGAETLRDRIAGAASVFADRDRPASGAAGLISTAQGDYRSILAALYAEGYYGGAISIRINGREASQLTPATQLSDPLRVDIAVETGAPYTFGQLQIVNRPPARRRLDLTNEDLEAREAFSPGQRARAGVVDAAGERAVEDWRVVGYPEAAVESREVIADHPRRLLDVQIRLAPGPRARFAETTVEGARRVDPDFIAYMADIPRGQFFDPAALRRAQDRLNDLGAFRAARVREGEVREAQGEVPVTVEIIPRRPRRYGVGATLSSVDGLGLEGFWLHRNLFGRAERLRFDASITGIGTEGDAQDYDYRLGGSFIKPGVLSPEMSLAIGADLEREVRDDYEENSVSARIGFLRDFNPDLTGSVFAEVTYSDIVDDAGERETLVLSLPVAVEYDRRNEPLDATRGFFLGAEVEPFYETQFPNAGTRAIAEGRYYLSFADNRATIATRGEIGTILGGELDELPPSDLFFTGGGGSVRGYAFRSNGIEVDGDTLGGRSVLEGSLELRTRFGGRYGAVAFADGGLVGREELPWTDDTELRVGVGAGARFYTGIGPLRLDIATPIDPRDGDDRVVFYLGIGQAF